MEELKAKENFDHDGHILRSYDWDSTEGWKDRLADKIIPIIKELYLDLVGLKKNLAEDGLLDDTDIKKFIDDSLAATIPDASPKLPKQFRPRRADFAELLALICLEELHQTIIPVKNLFYRELTGAVGRGVDILGYELHGTDLALIICEIKGSIDRDSPPSVVETGDESMKSQLYSYVSDRKKTQNRILNIHKKSTGEHKKILAKIAALWWKNNNVLKAVVCPFLVRKADLYKSTDFGSFNSNPDHFHPAKVRFLIVCINDDIGQLSDMLYDKASNES
ncbi:MAG: hypothetical protein WC369_03055 [Dehalococcoidales bacterium]|jgi:hypothetical protein